MDGGLRCTGRRGGCGGAGAAASTACPCGHWLLQRGVRGKRTAFSAQISEGTGGGGGVEGCGSIPEGLTTKTKSPRRRLEAVTRSDVRPSALGWEWECEEARGRIRDGLAVAGAAMAPLAAYPRLDTTGLKGAAD